jgi:hypothetical protein
MTCASLSMLLLSKKAATGKAGGKSPGKISDT